jgi:hypothetical protein
LTIKMKAPGGETTGRRLSLKKNYEVPRYCWN